jgi:molecular chaperone GrpE
MVRGQMTTDSEKDDAQEGDGGAAPPASGRAPDGAAPASLLEGAGEGAASSKPAEAEDPLTAAKAEAQRFRDQLLRTAADFDNFRKRSRRDQEDAAKKGKESAVKELLPVFDNLERALQSSERAPDVKAVIDGLKLVMRQFGQSLEKMGIKRVQTVGHPFDPSQHEAIQHAESTEHPPGVITAEVQPGYLLGEQLLRAAMVVVSKGPPEVGEPPPPEEEPPN